MKPSIHSIPLPAAASTKMDATPKAMTQEKPTTVQEQPLNRGGEENTKNLSLRLASDAVSGLCAAVLVAPVITAIDK